MALHIKQNFSDCKKLYESKFGKLPGWAAPLLIIIIGHSFLYFYQIPYYMTIDSYSYVKYFFEYFLTLEFTNVRTPVYPIIIKFCQIIFGENLYIYAVVFLQIIVSIISAVYLYKALALYIKNTRIVSIITVLYALCPAVRGWGQVILTESFALSGVVFFIYLLFSYLKKPNAKSAVLAVILLFFLTFLRPSSLIFEFILAAFLIIRFIVEKKERKILIKPIITSVIAFCFIFAYSAGFMQTHGIFSISDPLPRQKLLVCIERGYYKQSSDTEFIEHLEGEFQKYEGDYAVHSLSAHLIFKYGNARINQITSECIANSRGKYISDTFRIMAENSKEPLHAYQEFRPRTTLIGHFMYFVSYVTDSILKIFNTGHAYFFILFELILSVYLWVRKKKIPWIHLGLCSFLFAITVSTFIATNAEYQRTMICVVPFMYVSLALAANTIYNRIIKIKVLPEM